MEENQDKKHESQPMDTTIYNSYLIVTVCLVGSEQIQICVARLYQVWPVFQNMSSKLFRKQSCIFLSLQDKFVRLILNTKSKKLYVRTVWLTDHLKWSIFDICKFWWKYYNWRVGSVRRIQSVDWYFFNNAEILPTRPDQEHNILP